MVETSPDAANKFIAAAPELEDGSRVAAELGLKEVGTKALEAGVACRESMFRIANVGAVVSELATGRPVARGTRSLILDVQRIYLSAYIDAVRNFACAALGQLIPEDQETANRRAQLKEWLTARKKVLSTGRETVAHANPAFISGITEDELWPPMLLLNVLSEDALLEMFRDGVESDETKFESRVGQLLNVAALAFQQGNEQLDLTAQVIASKLPGIPAS